jgi:hypothetical protein
MPPPAPVNVQLQSSQPPGGQQGQQQQQYVDGQPAAGEVGRGAWGMGITDTTLAMFLGPQNRANSFVGSLCLLALRMLSLCLASYRQECKLLSCLGCGSKWVACGV